MAKWRLDQTEAREDGSGTIAFDIWGLDDNDEPIPGKHTTNVLIAAADIEAALALPTNNETNQAIKALIGAELPEAEWSEEALDEIVLANSDAVTADASLDTYVNDEIGGYPVTFTA